MSKPITSLDSLCKQPWIQAELSYVQSILDYLLDEEARQAPEVARVLRGFSAARGKLLRPLLVILGARTEGSGPEVYPPGYPSQKSGAPGTAELSRILRHDHGFLTRLKRSGWTVSAKEHQEILEWKNQPAFPGGLPRRIYLLAASLELLHLATLVHDDVIDGSTQRRGLPAVWKQIGASQAVLLGDLLLSLTFALVSHGAEPQTGQLLSSMVRVMCRSEFFQAEDRERFFTLLQNPSRRRYVRVITGKTALLFSLAFHVGAREMGAEGSRAQMLRRAGYYLGLAFQIQDDILDFKGDPKRFGKPLGQDLRDGQITLPVIEALKSSQKNERVRLIQGIRRFKSGDENAFSEILEEIETAGGFVAAHNEAHTYMVRAEAEIDRVFQDGPSSGHEGLRTTLVDLNTLLASRRY
ncbi:polyprenyl synthetase family protein [Spirochaeta lutea]|uniref:polyprenyl synthetase family protein n=1 Tax=Spirochaeta lutea TaxID=1480694 RepID=UPI00068D778B|nr:polyprenyl synthetase family protein [Spirochaeta lutea]